MHRQKSATGLKEEKRDKWDYFPGPSWQQPSSNTTSLWTFGRNLRKLIFSYSSVLLQTTITMIIIVFIVCLKMLMQIKQEIPMKYTSGKLRFNLIAQEKLEVHFEVKSTYFMFTFTSSEHCNNHKTLLESVVVWFSRGGIRDQ